MSTRSRLNNRKLRALRTETIYEAIMTDLCLIGALDRDVTEKLIGHKLCAGLKNPLTDELFDATPETGDTEAE